MPVVQPKKKLEQIERAKSTLSSSGLIDSEATKGAIDQLCELHMEQHKLRVECRREYAVLIQKYLKASKPLYEKRAEILKPRSDTQKSLVTDFWLQALKHHATFSASIEVWDEPVLKHITDIQADCLDGDWQKSFRITFHFEPNAFFTNSVLTKQFVMDEDEETGENLLVQAIGTKIDWKPGKDVTVKIISKRQRHKLSKEMRTVTVKKARPSFFNFFRTRVFPTEQELQVMRESEVQRLENYFSVEYELGQILRDRIVPLATGWYLDIEYDSEEDLEGSMACEASDDEDEEDEEITQDD
ncbi:nucleosome assembly protein [Gregarina niphandrodes]|uniref:Nucleosome assembly protein n=1 Tax=Gregarina niphandrodes TaxID=110365 RepID=A0A023B2P4_GRENI|nr:nucleosome assembly protein [Gregarina niphandrodes]EZG51419.1 nucleosome assembly protein [Gregarina niphandrodes]|eukprot:XP_011131974.1 nucleosome assembly protein [Gregarina niphandrodes]